MIKSLRVLAILPSSEYFSPQRGGALATWVYQVYRRLPLDARVITVANNNLYAVLPVLECHKNNIAEKLYAVLRNRSFWGLLESIKYWLRNDYNRRVARHCRSFNPSIIHIQNDYEAVLSVKRLNPQALIILHMQNDHLVEADDLKRAEESCHAADKIAFCSEYLRCNLLKTFPSVPWQKTFVIFNGADASSSLSSVRLFENDPRLLFVGRIVPQKGLHLLLEAIDSVFECYPKATLRIVGGINFGSNEEDEYLQSLRQKASVWSDRIVFVGPVPHDQIFVEFTNADLFICPSVWNEPLGMVNAEAMSCGLPVVAFARGGIPEIVGDAGILVEEISATALAEAIKAVLSNPELRQKLSQQGIERVSEKFNWPAISQIWLQELQSLERQSKI
jgi:glycosyltransferase involved in cell wall biosynthesis